MYTLVAGIAVGQGYVEDENWLKGFRTEADSFSTLTYWPERTFTLEDVVKGKEHLGSIRRSTPQNEWEGLYYANTEIGDNKLIWNAEGGFFHFYFYHTLKRFSFGGIKDHPGFIEFDYERDHASKRRKGSVPTRLIKVRIDDSHFLVPESRLRDFCERAAGLGTDLADFHYWWTRERDMQKEREGLPILPPEFRHFLRNPIETKITGLGDRKISQPETSPPTTEVHYYITLGAGKDKKLRSNMNFFVKDLGEWVRLTKVFKKRSLGFIRRDFDEKNQERCRDGIGGSGLPIPCREIKVGMQAKTRGDF